MGAGREESKTGGKRGKDGAGVVERQGGARFVGEESTERGGGKGEQKREGFGRGAGRKEAHEGKAEEVAGMEGGTVQVKEGKSRARFVGEESTRHGARGGE